MKIVLKKMVKPLLMLAIIASATSCIEKDKNANGDSAATEEIGAKIESAKDLKGMKIFE